MALTLTTEQIDAEAFARWGEMKGAPLAMCRGFARAIEDEVRKQDEALIRKLVEALEYHRTQTRPIHQTNEAIVRGRARLQRLEGKP